MGKTRSYQLLNAARVIGQSTIVDSPHLTSQVPESEAIARELVPLLNNPKALNQVWNDAVRNVNGVPTAKEVHDIVARNLATPLVPNTPLHDLEGIDPIKLATRAPTLPLLDLKS